MSNREIRATDSSNEWSHWVTEKASNVLKHLSHIATVVRTAELDPTAREDLESELGAALWDTIKLVSFGTGVRITGNQLGDYCEEIATVGGPAYPQVARELGVEIYTPPDERSVDLLEVIKELELCVNLPRSEGRTRLHGALLRVESTGGALIRRLLDGIENVTMGNLAWEEFVPDARNILSALKEKNRLQ